jgi:hypothetical protein
MNKRLGSGEESCAKGTIHQCQGTIGRWDVGIDSRLRGVFSHICPLSEKGVEGCSKLDWLVGSCRRGSPRMPLRVRRRERRVGAWKELTAAAGAYLVSFGSTLGVLNQPDCDGLGSIITS